jgi:hypothetical protein
MAFMSSISQEMIRSLSSFKCLESSPFPFSLAVERLREDAARLDSLPADSAVGWSKTGVAFFMLSE